MLNKIPGFRSDRRRNKIIGVIGYAFLVIGLLSSWGRGQTPLDSFVRELTWILMFLALYLPITNVFHVRDRLFFLNRKTPRGRVFGITGFVVCCIILIGIVNTIKSDKQKAFDAAQQAKLQEAQAVTAKLDEQKKADEAKQKQEAKDKADADAKAKAQADADAKAKAAADAKAKADADAKAKADADEKAKADADAKAKADAEAKQKADDEAKKQLQNTVTGFEQKIYDMEKPATAALKNFQQSLLDFGNGKITINDAYESASNAKKACDDTQYAYGTLSTPDGLPDDVNKLLKDAAEDLSTSYYTRSEALKAIMKYFDDQKPSEVQDYKDNMKMADSFTMSGVGKIFEAKSKVGIDISAQNKTN